MGRDKIRFFTQGLRHQAGCGLGCAMLKLPKFNYTKHNQVRYYAKFKLFFVLKLMSFSIPYTISPTFLFSEIRYVVLLDRMHNIDLLYLYCRLLYTFGFFGCRYNLFLSLGSPQGDKILPSSQLRFFGGRQNFNYLALGAVIFSSLHTKNTPYM